MKKFLLVAGVLCACAGEGNQKFNSLWDVQLDEVRRLDEAAEARWAACQTPSDVQALQADLRSAMVRAIGGFPERTPLNPVITEVVPREGYRVEKVYFESQPKFYVTGLFYRPDGSGSFPVVVITCGHSGNGKGSDGYQRACVMAAKSGLAAFIYDPVDQGEREQLANRGGSTSGHNRIGLRAALLGWSMARFRIWDAMRALDYVASRDDVDKSRIGLMGNSGGGTLTSLTMALDNRIQVAAPSCYLSTLRHVCEDCGPQDAEQNIFGQLAFGLNHLGYVALRAPRPTLMVCKEGDFFPIRGSRITEKFASGVYAAAGRPDAYAMFAAPGSHGWVESTRTASVAWMRRWLRSEGNVFDSGKFKSFMAKDKNFKIKDVDCGLVKSYEVAPRGNVRNLPGAVTAYDILRAEAKRQQAARVPVTAESIRKIAGIRSAAEIPEAKIMKGLSTTMFGGHSATCWRVDVGGGVTLTAKAMLPKGEAKGLPVMLLASEGQLQANARALELLGEGRAVLVANLRGFGETLPKNGHVFYGSDYPEEGIAAMAYLVGKNLVAERAEDAIGLARIWAKECGSTGVEAFSFGRAAIPLAHAAAIEKTLIAKRDYIDAPASWSEWFDEDGKTVYYADIVNGAFAVYDWKNL